MLKRHLSHFVPSFIGALSWLFCHFACVLALHPLLHPFDHSAKVSRRYPSPSIHISTHFKHTFVSFASLSTLTLVAPHLNKLEQEPGVEELLGAAPLGKAYPCYQSRWAGKRRRRCGSYFPPFFFYLFSDLFQRHLAARVFDWLLREVRMFDTKRRSRGSISFSIPRPPPRMCASARMKTSVHVHMKLGILMTSQHCLSGL